MDPRQTIHKLGERDGQMSTGPFPFLGAEPTNAIERASGDVRPPTSRRLEHMEPWRGLELESCGSECPPQIPTHSRRLHLKFSLSKYYIQLGAGEISCGGERN